MSDIRTLVDLQDAMSSEFAWRKKELHSLKTLVLSNEATYNRELCIRAALTLLYAHWEGFVRQTGTYYLEFVARRRLKNEELPANFLALVIRRIVKQASTENNIQRCLDVIAFFQKTIKARSSLDWNSAINTKSNLSSSVLREIILILGLDYSRFSTKEKLIDEKLLGNRNRIAHGKYLLVGLEEYLELHDEMVGLMQDFYNQVDNSANVGSYKVT